MRHIGSNLKRMRAASRRLRQECHEDVSALLYGYGGITFGMTVLPFVTVWLTGALVDDLVAATQGDANPSMWRDVVILLTVGMVLAALGPLHEWVRNLLTRRLHHKYIMAVSHAIAHLDIAVIEAPDAQDAITKIVEQAPLRAPNFVQRTFDLRQNVGELLIAAAIMLYAAWWLALLLLLAMLPRLAVDLRYGRSMWTLQSQTADLVRKYWWSRWALTNPETLPVTKVHGGEAHFRRAMQDCHERIMAPTKQHERLNLLWQWGALIAPQVVSMAAMCHFVFEVLSGTLLVGQMIFLFGAVARYSTALGSLSSNLGKQYEDGLFVCEMFDLIDREPVVPRPVRPVSLRTQTTPAIEIVDATLAYPNGQVILRDVNIVIEPGTSLGLVGANGAGKTTLIKFLLGFYHPVAGRILIDGVDSRHIDLTRDWWPRLGVLFQQFGLSGQLTAKEVIALGRTSPEEPIDMQRVIAAAQKSGAHAFISKWPQGYDTPMERWFEGGENPSMGERQKIAIARTLYRCPQLLILDEPTSSIDARSEVEIFEHLLTAPHRHSTILISHRYHTLMAADQIAVVQDGRIAEIGDHAALMQRGGLYAAEFERQAQPYLRGLDAVLTRPNADPLDGLCERARA